jgi:subtilisin family serine protease
VGTPPQPYNYGNECSQAQINAGTCGEVDAIGHGTHVAGSAAGDGSATGNGVPQFKYTGMANKATIVMVKTDFTDKGLIDAVKYVFAKAALLGRPAVVNMSLGTNLGPARRHARPRAGAQRARRPGKVIVSSAGNEQSTKQHGHLVSTVALDSLTFAVPTYAGSGRRRLLPARRLVRGLGQLHGHAVSPTGIVHGPVTKGNFYVSSNNADGRVYIENDVV